MKKKRGFTIVELSMVIVVLGILVSLVLISFNRIQMQARDNKRRTDILVMINNFEQYYNDHKEYPTGCSIYPSSTGPGWCGGNNANYTTTITNAFYSDTTTTQLKGLFPSLSDTFGDPKQPQGHPFAKSGAGFSPHYVFMGQYDSSTVSGSGNGVIGPPSGSTEISCDNSTWIFNFTPAGALPKSTSFVLAYWSESDNVWYIYQGKHGEELKVGSSYSSPKARGTTVGKCVFMP